MRDFSREEEEEERQFDLSWLSLTPFLLHPAPFLIRCFLSLRSIAVLERKVVLVDPIQHRYQRMQHLTV